MVPPAYGNAIHALDDALLPATSHLLDSLLDSAALARPGKDAALYAATLRATARKVDALTGLVLACAHPPQLAEPLRISA